jgi:hypothetical protein
MKILYAASHYHNSGIQLSRFLNAMQDTDHTIKVAAYKSSSPKGQAIDWTLDALLNIIEPHRLSLDGDNLSVYLKQVQSWGPDLVISDLEYFTSKVANELNLPLWQYSSYLINFAISRQERNSLGIHRNYSEIVKHDAAHYKRAINVIDNSDRSFVCSHFGDIQKPLTLNSNFQWARPYHEVSKYHVPCQHFLTASLVGKNKRILAALKKYPDCVAFTDGLEHYDNPSIKDIGMKDEYYCNLKNSVFFACQGYASFLADGFYNGKHSLIFPDYEDGEAIISSQLSQSLGTGSIVSGLDDIASITPMTTQPRYSNDIKYLHQYIEEL